MQASKSHACCPTWSCNSFDWRKHSKFLCAQAGSLCDTEPNCTKQTWCMFNGYPTECGFYFFGAGKRWGWKRAFNRGGSLMREIHNNKTEMDCADFDCSIKNLLSVNWFLGVWLNDSVIHLLKELLKCRFSKLLQRLCAYQRTLQELEILIPVKCILKPMLSARLFSRTMRKGTQLCSFCTSPFICAYL